MGRQRSRPSRRVDRDVQAIGALTQAVLDGDDLEHLLGRIAAEARVLVDAVSGVVVTVSDAGEMNFRGVAGLSIGPLKVGHIMPVRDTLTELALTKATNIVARDVGEIPEAGRAFAAATGTGPLIASPLAQIGSARGVLVVARTVIRPLRPRRHQPHLYLRRTGRECDRALRAPICGAWRRGPRRAPADRGRTPRWSRQRSPRPSGRRPWSRRRDR